MSRKPSSPWKSPYTIVRCLNNIWKIKNTANQKDTVVHYDHFKPFVQRPEELQLPRRGRSLPRVPESKSVQKPNLAFHQHCNCSQTLSDQLPPSLGHRSASPAPFSAVLSQKLPSKDLLLKFQNKRPQCQAEPLFVFHLNICLRFHRKHNLQL